MTVEAYSGGHPVIALIGGLVLLILVATMLTLACLAWAMARIGAGGLGLAPQPA